MFFFLQDLPPAVPVECIINKTSYYLIPFSFKSANPFHRGLPAYLIQYVLDYIFLLGHQSPSLHPTYEIPASFHSSFFHLQFYVCKVLSDMYLYASAKQKPSEYRLRRLSCSFKNELFYFSCYIFIIPDIIHPPTAPHFSISFHCSSSNFIPPIPYTGILTSLHTSSKNSSPLGSNPFLQSVA